jgi:hypothetical protein
MKSELNGLLELALNANVIMQFVVFLTKSTNVFSTALKISVKYFLNADDIYQISIVNVYIIGIVLRIAPADRRAI